MHRWRLLAMSLVFAFGCATTPSTASNTASPDFITTAEIQAANAATAYDIVQRLRPTWLRAGATASITGTQSGGQARAAVTLVYLDNMRLGGIDALRTVNSHAIRSIRFLDATRASTVLSDIGTQPISGAIVISTRN